MSNRRNRPVNPARAVSCVCGRRCASAAGLRTHERTCPVEQARSAAFVDAIEQGRDPHTAAAAAVARALAGPCANCGTDLVDHDDDAVRTCQREHDAHLAGTTR